MLEIILQIVQLLFEGNNTFSDNLDGTNNGSAIPNRICGCVNGQPDCSDPPSPYEVSVYPGQTVGVLLLLVREMEQYQQQPLLNMILTMELHSEICKIHKE